MGGGLTVTTLVIQSMHELFFELISMFRMLRSSRNEDIHV